MFEFFNMVAGFLETAFNFVVNVLSMLITLIQVLVGAIGIPVTLAAAAPSILGTSIVIFLAVYVAKFIIGR